MAKEQPKTGLKITREQMIQLLNEDLAGEYYQAVIAGTVNSQVPAGAAAPDRAQKLEPQAWEELAHAMKLAQAIDGLGGKLNVIPQPIQTANDPGTLLATDLAHTRETVRRYHERILQAEAMGEGALSRTLRGIIRQEQELEIQLSAALDDAGPPAPEIANQTPLLATNHPASPRA